jgi:DNA-binding Lrp family transcriptional regulator
MALSRLKKSSPRTKKGSSELDAEQSIRNIFTPYDDVIPSSNEITTKFYLDIVRVYFGLCSGTISLDDASVAARGLRTNPEYAKNPIDPSLLPINEEYKQRLLDNLTTLIKYNLVTADAVKSALSFAFLDEAIPISTIDFAVLRYFSKNPLETLVSSGESLDLSPKTVARSLRRLSERFKVRFGCHLDTSAFGIQSALLFFTLMPDVEWPQVENALAIFPITKGIMKTTMTDLGYATFLIPGGNRSMATFRASVAPLKGVIFDHMQLHVQEGMGSCFNLSLYEMGEWAFPSDLKSAFEEDHFPQDVGPTRHLECSGPRKGFTPKDFLVASEYKKDARALPSSISQGLKMRGWDFDTRRVSQSIQKIHAKRVALPFMVYDGLGLSANFCFEILCNNEWKKHILSALPALANVMYFSSNKGILLWIQVPSQQQVDYYQMFRSLEKKKGVKSVQSIMTIAQKGTRTMHELVHYWDYRRNQWSVPPGDLDLGAYLLDDNTGPLY